MIHVICDVHGLCADLEQTELSNASVLVVIEGTPCARRIESLLVKYPEKIIVTNVPFFLHPRVFYTNFTARDLDLMALSNYLYSEHVVHVDVKMRGPALSHDTQVVEGLHVVLDIIGPRCFEECKVRFSFNKNAVHVSGYHTKMNLTFSIYVQSAGCVYEERVEVHTPRDTWRLNAPRCTFAERYACAFQCILRDAHEGRRYYQDKLRLIYDKFSPSKIKRTSVR